MSPLNPDNPRMNDDELADLRARLDTLQGPDFWRSLEEFAGTEAFHRYLQRAYPRQASAWNPAMDRRAFLSLMGASLALAGLSGCTLHQPREQIVPYIDQPDGLTPGRPQFFATAIPHNGYAQGALVTSREGRPIKVEGNPLHPATLGRSDAWMQASVLSLYDPDRSQAVVHLGQPGTWDDFFQALTAQMTALQATRGAGLRLLTGTVTSPTLAAQIGAILAQYPQARWHVWEPVGRDSVHAAARQAFGTEASTLYRFDQADVILSLDGDFLLSLPGHVRYASDFAARRRVRQGQTAMNRLYMLESVPTITGAMADFRLPVRTSRIPEATATLARALGVTVPGGYTEVLPEAWIRHAVADLQAHPGASIVVAGDHQPQEVHVLAHAMNAQLGNVGKTVVYTDPVEANVTMQAGSLVELVRDLQAGQVQTLLMWDTNPVYTAPTDLDFAGALSRVAFSAHLSQYEDETSALCQWHLPETHILEAWSDARAYDGTISLIQPLLAPLYATRTAHELLEAVRLKPSRSAHDIVRDAWQSRRNGEDFGLFWRKTLHDGLIAGSAAPPKNVTLLPNAVTALPPAPAASGLELQFAPDPTIWDGRFANNGWLQELPKPLTKLTWDNALLVSPKTAAQWNLNRQMDTDGRHPNRVDSIAIRAGSRRLTAPVWIVPGHPDDAVTLTLGYGRARCGRIGTETGVNAYVVRASDALWFVPDVEITRTGETYPLACTHTHHTMEGRDLIRVSDIAEFRRKPDVIHEHERAPERPESLIPDWRYPNEAWGMSIDTNVCIGCNACVVACQAENNIPIVGKDEVERGREMHWLRIDRYYTGSLNQPQGTYFLPVPCMHCETAPCELVCPVGATVHDRDGLNEMIYNRCVGTRYCSNNCPYKVRRFNFFHYAGGQPDPDKLNANYDNPIIKLVANPEVTIRSRGVMEKCTYCIQRIQNARIDAEVENRPLRDGEIRTACQQACPTNAIVFGNINDPNSEVARAKAQPHNYGLLTELNTRPRTTYLARFTHRSQEEAG